MPYRTWTEKDLIDACEKSNCYADVLKNLGLAQTGGNHTTIKKYIKKFNIDISAWNYKPRLRPKIDIKELLIKNDLSIRVGFLRDRIIKENIIEYRCDKCGINTWMNDNISLHLDHINGDFSDNRIENLRFLCPNCHSQTPNFGTKNSKRKLIKNVCWDCGEDVYKGSIRCKNCANKNRTKKYKISWPSPEIILEMVEKTNFLEVARKLGVSDNAIRKHLKKLGFDVPRKKIC